jgi:hypothetical protein
MGMHWSPIVDLGVVIIANAVNLLLTAIFLARSAGNGRIEDILGRVTVALGAPLAAGIALNISRGRAWWTVALPSVLLLYLLVEYVLDYRLRVNFRHTKLLGPYLFLFYAAVNAMTGYAFLVSRTFGAITLATYFVCLFATWYSYARVGHGQRHA